MALGGRRPNLNRDRIIKKIDQNRLTKRLSSGSILIWATLFASGCAQPEGTIGSNVGGGPVGTPGSVTLNVLTDTSFHHEGFGNGGSAHLYAGESNGIRSLALLRFSRPFTGTAFRVDSARFEMAWEGGIGTSATPEIESRLLYHPWTESTQPKRSDLPGGTILNNRIVDGDDSGSIHISIDPAEVTAWIALVDSTRSDSDYTDPGRPDTSLTLLITSIPNDRLVRFRSRSATADSLRPWLYIYATFADSTNGDTIKVGPTGDLFIAEDATPLPANRLTIGGGAPVRSALSFDMDTLWSLQSSQYITINRAVLTLTRDRSLFSWAPWTRSVWPYQMTSKRWLTEPDSAEYSGFILTPTAVDSTADTLQLVINSPVTVWAKGDSTNYGLILETATEGLDLDRIAFYGSEDPDPSKRPRLTVFYTGLPR